MAVAFDAASETERTGTSDPTSHTHTPVGTPRAVVVSIIHGTSVTDHAVGVTYGGVALSRIVRATDATGEPGAAELWFLGSGIPTGPQTIQADWASATTDDIHLSCITLTASANTEVVDFDSTANDQANPSLTLNYSGRTCLAIGSLYDGIAIPTGFTENANCTRVNDEDFGAFSAVVTRQTTAGSSDFAIGGSAANNSCAFVAIAVSEVAGTVFNSTLSGGITPAGVLVKQTKKVVAGGITPAGALVKVVSRALSGAITPAGALVKTTTKVLAGAFTPSGALASTKVAVKTLTGAMTPAGALLSRANKTLAGAITPAGALVKQLSRALAGVLAPGGGALVKTASKPLAGSLTPAGTIVKQAKKILAGGLTPSGVLAAVKVAVKALVGAITPGTGDVATTYIPAGPAAEPGKLTTYERPSEHTKLT